MLQVLLTENYILVNETVMKGFGLLISSSLILRKRVYTSASKKIFRGMPQFFFKRRANRCTYSISALLHQACDQTY